MYNYLTSCPFCEHQFTIEYLQVNLICPQCKSLIGYHEDSSPTMPKPGMYFILPKGVEYHSMLKGHLTSKRKTKKRLHHMLNGVVTWGRGEAILESNPQLRWVGSGNYWCTADINHVELL